MKRNYNFIGALFLGSILIGSSLNALDPCQGTPVLECEKIKNKDCENHWQMGYFQQEKGNVTNEGIQCKISKSMGTCAAKSTNKCLIPKR